MFGISSVFWKFDKNIKWNIFIYKLLIDYLPFVKNLEELCVHFDEISQFNIDEILDAKYAKSILLETVISDLLELPNLKTNLEELEIKSNKNKNIKEFTKNWSEFDEGEKFNQITFICRYFESIDTFELKKKIEKLFKQVQSI